MARVSPQFTGSSTSVGRQSLQFNDQEHDKTFDSGLDVNQEIKFMEHLQCKECNHFIYRRSKQTSSEPDEERKCQCNYTFQEHRKDAQNLAGRTHGANWNPKTHTINLPTNAYGEIEFVGRGDNVAKYVRVSTDTEIETIFQLLMEAWGLQKPNLVISVAGGALDFNMKTRLREAFHRGLMKVALSTGMWIITTGIYSGVIKRVGEAVRDFGHTTEGRVVTLGIASWGSVQNKEHLIAPKGSKGMWPAIYRINSINDRRKLFLDPNHTHFLLVDDGTQECFGVEMTLRAKLEGSIRRHKTETGDPVDVCLLVLEGGPVALETIRCTLKNGTPTVVFKGTGRAADILAYAYENVTEKIYTDNQLNTQKKTYLEPHVQTQIEEMVMLNFGDRHLTDKVACVLDCCENIDLLSVFDLDSQSSPKEMDLVILKALLKAKKNDVMSQLKLVLDWNRVDVAKSEIFIYENKWPPGSLDDIMLSALQRNRADFVELFLYHGVSLKDFVTIKRLITLYNSVPKKCLLHVLLTRIKGDKSTKEFSLLDVGRLLQDLVGDIYQNKYLMDKGLRELDVSSELDSPLTFMYDSDAAHELFVWAVLMNYHKLSKLFWRESRASPMAGALLADNILTAMERHAPNSNLATDLQVSADDYRQMSVGILNACHSADEWRTHQLLVREMETWGGTTCIRLAVQAENRQFVAQSACQTLYNTFWHGCMEQDNSLMAIILCTVVFPLIPVLICFTMARGKKIRPAVETREATLTRMLDPWEAEFETQGHNLHQGDPGVEVNKPGTFKKIGSFYASPIVKFILNVYAYTLFLLLYSYILVVHLSEKFHILEGVLMAWVFTIFLEEVRQFSQSYASTLRSKMTSYLKDMWNVLDIITILLFVLAVSLRFIPGLLDVSRIAFSINLIAFFSRILHIFSISKQMGPKISMIYQMIQDLKWFVAILLVFVISYAVASEAILYPESELNWKLFFYLPRKAYWHIYGELFLEDIEGENTCTNDPALYNNYSVLRCPSQVGKYFVPILLGLYILMTNVLLLNLLIAMFSYTFQQIHENTDMHWCFQRVHLVHEYMRRPVLPPPFILASHIYLVLIKAAGCCSSKEYIDKRQGPLVFRRKVEDRYEEKQLIRWEKIIASNHVNSCLKGEKDSVAGKMEASMEKLEEVLDKVEELQECKDKISQIETQLMNTTKALDGIMSALQELGATGPKPVEPDSKKLEEEVQRKQLNLNETQREQQQQQQQQQGRDLSEKKIQIHYKSRTAKYLFHPYVLRFYVPDEKVLWETDFPEYDPPIFTSLEVLQRPDWADEDLMSLNPEAREGKILFNKEDPAGAISRISFVKPYKVKDGLPLNPIGRTGLQGRGLMGRWGPNHVANLVVTRWKMQGATKCVDRDDKPVLEFVAVRLKDNSSLALPGGVCSPDADAVDVLRKEREIIDTQWSKQLWEQLEEVMEVAKANAQEIYRGYADDPCNTDNAWLETRVVNYHIDDHKLIELMNMKATDEVNAVIWETVSSSLTLHGFHSYLLKVVADFHKAAF